MTIAELDARLAKLSDDDLQEIVEYEYYGMYESSLVRGVGLMRLSKRMAREILDLRMRLAELERCPNIYRHLNGIGRCDKQRGHEGECFYVGSMD